MLQQLHFAYPFIFYSFIPLWALLNLYRLKFHRSPVYLYPLTDQIRKTGFAKTSYHKKILFVLHSLVLLGLIFLIARPQWVDSRSKIKVDGVDIMLTLDVSGSMRCFDSLSDQRQRITVAKEEAIKFVTKRPDDPIGIVIFGADAVSQCPLTLDKTILKKLIQNIKLGIINPNGTSLASGIATTVNKLKNSKAKSKIIILLTDGQPTPETDPIPIQTALDLAKEYKVRIYTIAIGNKNGGYITSAFGFVERVPDSVDEQLLKTIAQQTNGRFFRANRPNDMKRIYAVINKLEKTEYETNLFSQYYEAFASFIWIVLLLFALQLLLQLFWWRGI